MRRLHAHLLAAGFTLLLLEGASIGVAAGLAASEIGDVPVRTFDAWHAAATAAWVIVLLAPAVAWLESRRRLVWRAALGAALLATVARLALDWREGPSAAVAWSLVDGLGLALGLLFYDLVFGLLRGLRTS